MIRVYIVDNHPLVLEGFRSLFCVEKEIELVGQATNGAACLAFFMRHTADIILMDINLPDMSGIDLCAAIKAKHPGTMVLGLSSLKEGRYVISMMENGASGYVMKNADKEEILHAIQMAYAGKTYLSFEAEEAVKRATNNKHPLPALTRREKEVLLLIAEGYTNPGIAGKLFISAATVDSHRKKLLAKLNVKNTAMLIKYAMDNQLLV